MIPFIILLSVLASPTAAWVKEMEDPSLFEGDMMLTPQQARLVKEGKYRFGSITDRLWPTTIPYNYDRIIASSASAIRAIQAAIADYHKYD